MPTFTYKCSGCGETFDYLILDKSEKPECPKCKSTKAEKLITGCNVGGQKSAGSSGHAGGGCSCCPHNK